MSTSGGQVRCQRDCLPKKKAAELQCDSWPLGAKEEVVCHVVRAIHFMEGGDVGDVGTLVSLNHEWGCSTTRTT